MQNSLPRHLRTSRAIAFLCCFGAVIALAQTVNLPPPAKTVFKCESNGNTIYSDSPCLGAKKVDIQPTQGMNRYSGKERIGEDVRREHLDKIMTDALQPVTGMNAEQRAAHARRFKLPPQIQSECQSLDRLIAADEEKELNASGIALSEVQNSLLRERKKYRQLGC